MKMVSRIPLCLRPDGGIPADEWLSSPGQPEVNAKRCHPTHPVS